MSGSAQVSHDSDGFLVTAQPHEDRMTQGAVVRPLGILDLSHEDRLAPRHSPAHWKVANHHRRRRGDARQPPLQTDAVRLAEPRGHLAAESQVSPSLRIGRRRVASQQQ